MTDDPELERRKTIFQQDCEDFRSLNTILWQIPVIVSTLTGGLWFGVTKIGNDTFIKASLFFLAGVVNIAFVIVLWRLRNGVMQPILEAIHNYQGRPTPRQRYIVIIVFTVILLISAMISFTGLIRILCASR